MQHHPLVLLLMEDFHKVNFVVIKLVEALVIKNYIDLLEVVFMLHSGMEEVVLEQHNWHHMIQLLGYLFFFQIIYCLI